MLRYDAAIIGAGADGLAAAVTLAKSGLKVVVLERAERPGGRCATREFHPGFLASPYCDELAPIPADMFWALDIARHGAIFVPSPQSTALWPDRVDVLARDDAVLAQAEAVGAAAIARARTGIARVKRLFGFGSRLREGGAWPGDDWNTDSLRQRLAVIGGGEDALGHRMARTLAGRAAEPELAGSALHLLAPGAGGSGLVMGGLARLADALAASATQAGAEIRCGLEVTDVVKMFGRVAGVRLADGTEISARAILSTLDLKRTFLSLFAWKDLPSAVSQRVANLRVAGQTARLLVALDRLPDVPPHAEPAIFRGPIHVAPDANSFADAFGAWRASTIAEHLPMMLRFPSVLDLRLCVPPAAVMTATVSAIPSRLFDGAWTHEKRDALRDRILSQVETVLPGVSSRVVASALILPPDIEEEIGLTDGDLSGGELAPDQMLGLRPWLDCESPRTPLDSVYLAGLSSAAGPLGACAAGVIAAEAIIADLKSGHLR